MLPTFPVKTWSPVRAITTSGLATDAVSLDVFCSGSEEKSRHRDREVLGHLLWLLRKIANEENLNDSGTGHH